MRKLTLLAVICGLLFVASLAQAQQGDAMFGFGTLLSSGSSSSCATSLCPEKGGFYPSVSADVIFHRRIGFNFETTWRGGQGLYGGPQGQPYRPIILDFNGMYQPKIGKKAGLDLFGGIGWQSTRYYGYNPSSSCVYFGACFTSSHHFLVDLGGGVRYYVRGHLFIRPEVHYYNILNNNTDFSSNNVIHVGASIGYTIGPD
ncbi:MAG TPA: hypothetical protein VIW68_06245 [Candidatus Sulfotelmatobacter sp.]